MAIELSRKQLDRFWSNVDRTTDPDGCWIWLGAKDRQGRGKIKISERGLYAQRIAWWLEKGSEPLGRLRHDCDGRSCIKPSHLHDSGDLEHRFWSFVDKTPGNGPQGECWLWTGAITRCGYGMFVVARNDRPGAHRMSLRLCGVELPSRSSGLMVCHRCHIRTCVNPNHLYVGTGEDNMHDMQEAGRDNYFHGEKHYRTTLTESDVYEIRRLAASKTMTHQEIAEQFEICRAAVGSIASRKNWKHLQ